MHVAAIELRKTEFHPRHLGRALRNGNNGLIISILGNVKTHEHGPGKKLKGFHQPPDSFFLNAEAPYKVARCHAGNPSPDSLNETFSGFVSMLFLNGHKPETVYHSVVPKEETQVLPQLRCFHVFQDT